MKAYRIVFYFYLSLHSKTFLVILAVKKLNIQ